MRPPRCRSTRSSASDFDFRIPDYQRPYAWGTDEALQLLDDLADALDRTADEPYFLGSIVLVKDKGNPAAEIIDGQQRLTTLTILFAVLRDLSTDDDLSREIQVKISEPGQKLMGLDAKPRLALRARDRPFFQKHIQEPGSIAGLLQLKQDNLVTDAQQNFRDNAAALKLTSQRGARLGRPSSPPCSARARSSLSSVHRIWRARTASSAS